MGGGAGRGKRWGGGEGREEGGRSQETGEGEAGVGLRITLHFPETLHHLPSVSGKSVEGLGFFCLQECWSLLTLKGGENGSRC